MTVYHLPLISDIPRVITRQMPVSVIWARGLQQSLNCPVDANPPLIETIWTKGQQTKIQSQGRFDILLNGTLLVSDVQQTDAGSYSCTPKSALGLGEPSPNVQVVVRGKTCKVHHLQLVMLVVESHKLAKEF